MSYTIPAHRAHTYDRSESFRSQTCVRFPYVRALSERYVSACISPRRRRIVSVIFVFRRLGCDSVGGRRNTHCARKYSVHMAELFAKLVDINLSIRVQFD